MWKQETLHSLHRLLRNTRSFCDPYLDRNGDDNEEEENTLSIGSLSNGSFNQMFREIQHGLVLTTAQSGEELASVNPTHISEGFEFVENNLQSREVDTGFSPLFPAVEFTKTDAQGQCDCFDGNLSISIVSESDYIHESQGHTPKGASDSVKTPRGKVGSSKSDRLLSVVVALRLCAFGALAVLCVVAINTYSEFSRPWMIMLHREQSTDCFLDIVAPKGHRCQLKFRDFISRESAALLWSETRKWFFAQADAFQIRWNATYCAYEMYASMEMIESVFSRAYNHPIWQHSFRNKGLPRLLDGSDDKLHVNLFHTTSRLLQDAHAKYLSGISTPWAHGREIGTSVARKVFVLCNIQLSACQLFVLQGARDTGCLLENLFMSIQRQYRMTEEIHEEQHKYVRGEMYTDDQIQDDTSHDNDMDREPLPTTPTIEQTDALFVPDDGALFEPRTRVGSKVEHVVSVATKKRDTDRNPGAAFLRVVESDFYNLEAIPGETFQVTEVAYNNDMRAEVTDFNQHLNRRPVMDFPPGPQKEALEQKSLLSAKVIEPDYVCRSEEFASCTADEIWTHRGTEAAKTPFVYATNVGAEAAETPFVSATNAGAESAEISFVSATNVGAESAETAFVSAANVDEYQEQPEITANFKSCEVHAEIPDKETRIKEYQPQQESPKVQTYANDDDIESEFPTPRQCFTRRCLARQRLFSAHQATGDE